MHKLKTTADGSKTLYIPELDETYHSVHGALQEAQHVFIQHGLTYIAKNKSEITVFEMGLGTGLNALLTALKVQELNLEINYVGLEAFPVEWDQVKTLEYENLFDVEVADLLARIHESQWNEQISINDSFSLLKLHAKIEDQPQLPQLDLVYYDAFGPRAQEAMWSAEHFDYLSRYTQPDGVLVTYCAQGQFKRNLKATGWAVERLPGPPGKREMTRATKL